MKKVIEQIGTTQAVGMASKAGIKITRITMVSWCRRYKIGHQLGTGRWMVYKDKLVDFLNGQKDKTDGK